MLLPKWSPSLLAILLLLVLPTTGFDTSNSLSGKHSDTESNHIFVRSAEEPAVPETNYHEETNSHDNSPQPGSSHSNEIANFQPPFAIADNTPSVLPSPDSHPSFIAANDHGVQHLINSNSITVTNDNVTTTSGTQLGTHDSIIVPHLIHSLHHHMDNMILPPISHFWLFSPIISTSGAGRTLSSSAGGPSPFGGLASLFGSGSGGGGFGLKCLSMCSCKFDIFRRRTETTCRSLSYETLIETLKNETTPAPATLLAKPGYSNGEQEAAASNSNEVGAYINGIQNTELINHVNHTTTKVVLAHSDVAQHQNYKNYRDYFTDGKEGGNLHGVATPKSLTTNMNGLITAIKGDSTGNTVWRRNRGRENRMSPATTPMAMPYNPNLHNQDVVTPRLKPPSFLFDLFDTSSNHPISSFLEDESGESNTSPPSALYNISTLTFTFNNIPHLSREIFHLASQLDAGHGLDSLQELYFYFNKIKTIDVDAFEDFRNISTANNNETSEISSILNNNTAEAPKGLRKLKIIEHHWHLNPGQYYSKIDPRVLEPFESTLEELHLSSPNIKSFPIAALVRNFRKLATLAIKSAALVDVNVNVNDAELKDRKIPESLVNLHIGSDMLDEIPKFVVPTHHIKKFTLSSQALSIVLADDFIDNLSFLEELYLTNCNISHIHYTAFAPLVDTLKHLDLHNNKLATIDARTFKGLKKLESIDLSGNDLVRVSDGTFKNLPSLEFLSLKYNRIATFGQDIFTETGGLKTLLLKSNSLTAVPIEVLAKLTQLEALDLSRNYIENISANSFSHNKKLERLDLSSNHISTLESKCFKGLEDSLFDLKLFHNRLNGTIDPGVMKELKNISLLDVSYNNLTSLSVSLFQGCQDSLIYMDLAFNPWHCDCKMKAFKIWLEDRIANLYFFHQFKARTILQRAKCATPQRTSGITLSFLPTRFFMCDDSSGSYKGLRDFPLPGSPNTYLGANDRNYSSEARDALHAYEEPKFIRERFYGDLASGPSVGKAVDDSAGPKSNEKLVYTLESENEVNPPSDDYDSDEDDENAGVKGDSGTGNQANGGGGGLSRVALTSALNRQQEMDLYLLKEIKNLYNVIGTLLGVGTDGVTSNHTSAMLHMEHNDTISNEPHSLRLLTNNQALFSSNSEQLHNTKRVTYALKMSRITFCASVFTILLLAVLIYILFFRRRSSTNGLDSIRGNSVKSLYSNSRSTRSSFSNFSHPNPNSLSYQHSVSNNHDPTEKYGPSYFSNGNSVDNHDNGNNKKRPTANGKPIAIIPTSLFHGGTIDINNNDILRLSDNSPIRASFNHSTASSDVGKDSKAPLGSVNLNSPQGGDAPQNISASSFATCFSPAPSTVKLNSNGLSSRFSASTTSLTSQHLTGGTSRRHKYPESGSNNIIQNILKKPTNKLNKFLTHHSPF